MIKSFAIFASLFVVGAAQAVIVAQDNAADVAYDNGWQVGDNGGFGFQGWGLGGSVNLSGRFIGGSQFNANNDGPQNINTAGRAFGLWANGGGSSSASRQFSVATQVGNRYRFDFDNGWIANGSVVSAGFRNRFGQEVGTLVFVGGNSSGTYSVWNGSQLISTSIGFTGRGLSYELLITSSSTFAATITAKDGSGSQMVSGTFSDQLETFLVTNGNAGAGSNHDLFVNSLEIEAVPEPATMLILGAGAALAARRRRKG